MQNKINQFFLCMLLLLSGECIGFASELGDVRNPGYSYMDRDVNRAVLNGLYKIVPDRNIRENNTTTAPVEHTYRVSESFFANAIATAAHNNLSISGIGLIPIHAGGHWAAMAVRRNSVGELVLLYNDSSGGRLDSDVTARDMAERIKVIEEQTNPERPIHIIDPGVHNQKSGGGCGAYTAEYLIQFASIDSSNLTPEYVSNLLKTLPVLQSDSDLREKQYQESLAQRGVSDSMIEATQVASSSAEGVSNSVHSRMNELQVLEFYPSGDDKKVDHGGWIVGSVGRAYYKPQNSILTNITKERSNSVMFGSDIKIDDRYTAGACASLGRSRLKSSESIGVVNIQTTIFSLYGDVMIVPNITLGASVYGGKLQVKNPDTKAVVFDREGDVIGANLATAYYRRVLSDIIFSPMAGVSFNQVKLKKSSEAKVVINGLTTEKVSLYTGFSLSKLFSIGDIKVIPEISARVSYSPIIKSGKMALVVQTGEIIAYQPNVSKAEKVRYSVALNVNVVTYKMVDLSLSYKKDWQSRYSSNTGFAKLRINF